MASLLLPADVREGAYALYAFCRMSDDAVDIAGVEPDAVSRLRSRLNRICVGEPGPDPVDRALADAVLRFAIPREALDALLEGLEWDATGRTYETLSDVYAYCARVAGSVGAMMAALMGARGAELVARACDLGVAMQLTNIARDVGEDARMGRLYLPRQWMREAGIDPEAWLDAPVYRPEIGGIIGRLLRRADDLYRRADEGIARLDGVFRPAIWAARRLYAEIGAQLERNGLDSISGRAVVPAWRKAWMLSRAIGGSVRSPGPEFTAPPLAETRFLVDAVGRASRPAGVTAPSRRRRIEDDLVWTLDLFASLEGRGRAQTPT